MYYTGVSFKTSQQDIRDILIAMLSELGFEGFEEGDDSLQAFIPEADYPAENVAEIAATLGLEPEISAIAPKNWNEEWESHFSPVTIEGFCTVRATFHPADTSVQHDIVITPKMSFGTGHHATTMLMMQQMRNMDFAGRSLLDFGAGTGILAILAHKLGAASITAIDNDEWAYENMLENMPRNNADSITVLKGSLEVVAGSTYDIILANINRHILLQYMDDMYRALNPGGVLLLSGIMHEDEDVVSEAATRSGFLFTAKNAMDKWILLQYGR